MADRRQVGFCPSQREGGIEDQSNQPNTIPQWRAAQMRKGHARANRTRRGLATPPPGLRVRLGLGVRA